MRAREGESKGGAEREGERIPSRLRIASAEPNVGLKLMNHEIMTQTEIKSQTLNLLSHPGTPCLKILTYTFSLADHDTTRTLR